MDRMLHLPCDAATAALGRALAPRLRAGDALLLRGEVGAGKSTLARALIRAAMDDPGHEVPSPTFTLVQTYAPDAGPQVWHADLYRLGDPGELAELGLEDAAPDAIRVVEWPEALGEVPGALTVALSHANDARLARLTGPGWGERLSGIVPPDVPPPWDRWPATALAADASPRRYWRLAGPGAATVVLQAGPDAAEDARFDRIGAHLRAHGFAAPALRWRGASGAAVLEDLGGQSFGAALDRDPATAMTAAGSVLGRLAGLPPPEGLPVLDAQAGAAATEVTARESFGLDAAPWADALRDALVPLDAAPRALALRDVHAGNLIWRPGRTGDARVGLLDFQDAVAAHPAYDLASLLRDVRRAVPGRAAALRAFLDASGLDAAGVEGALPVLAVQRNLRILGVFDRLTRQGRDGYGVHRARILTLLAEDLAHPSLAALRSALSPWVPA
ncbi:MAG: tRNA (adenosine(37)-N6)-threonylcarbamoyltransferase complex ATPase subunit type 1 TsaE [Paracoccaceae bacterium]